MHVHGDNLQGKEDHRTKYQDAQSREYLAEIRHRYDRWKASNLSLQGPRMDDSAEDETILATRVDLLNDYKDFLDQQHYAEKFDSRSNLHSSVLEEFMYYLFRDLVSEFSANALIGKSHTFKDIFFRAPSFVALIQHPHAAIERKDHDFAIGITVATKMQSAGSRIVEDHEWDIPAVAIECKTYLDKTMLQDASTAADQLKHKNPNAMYIVVAEWLKLTDAVNLKKFKIDQIYVFRKQRNTDREFRYLDGYEKNPIYPEVVAHLFRTVRDFLRNPWEGGTAFALERGFLI